MSMDPLVARRRHEELRAKFGKRDANMALVERVRAGEMHEVPEMAQYFSDDLPRATTANTVKVALLAALFFILLLSAFVVLLPLAGLALAIIIGIGLFRILIWRRL